MSAWIVGNESINKIVNSFYWLRENSWLREELKRNFKISFEGWDNEELNEQLRKFGQLLVNLNNKSVNQRYESKDKPYKFVYSDEATEETQHKNIFQFLKSVECLSYQSCEGNCETKKLYKFLQLLEEELKRRIIRDIEEYKNAKWE